MTAALMAKDLVDTALARPSPLPEMPHFMGSHQILPAEMPPISASTNLSLSRCIGALLAGARQGWVKGHLQTPYSTVDGWWQLDCSIRWLEEELDKFVEIRLSFAIRHVCQTVLYGGLRPALSLGNTKQPSQAADTRSCRAAAGSYVCAL